MMQEFTLDKSPLKVIFQPSKYADFSIVNAVFKGLKPLYFSICPL
jgi:hypothetical protein